MSGQMLTIDNALHGIRELLADKVSPEVGDPFAAQMVRLAGLLLKISANAVDDAAEVRVEENRAIRSSLGQAAALVGSDLAERWTLAAGSVDPGLKVSVLDEENHRLRCLLVEAQTALEEMPSEAARRLDQQIWRLLESIEVTRAPRE